MVRLRCRKIVFKKKTMILYHTVSSISNNLWNHFLFNSLLCIIKNTKHSK